MSVETFNKDTVYNRIYTNANISESFSSPVVELLFATNSSEGNPKFIFEIRSNISESGSVNSIPFLQFLFPSTENSTSASSIDLGNTQGNETIRKYALPKEITGDENEIRFYIISNGPTSANLLIKNASIFNK